MKLGSYIVLLGQVKALDELVKVLDELHNVGFSAADWEDLGMRLRPIPDLRVIAANHPNNVEGCLRAVIDHWQRNGESVSWETLAEAVTQCRGSGGWNVGKQLLRNVGIGW